MVWNWALPRSPVFLLATPASSAKGALGFLVTQLSMTVWIPMAYFELPSPTSAGMSHYLSSLDTLSCGEWRRGGLHTLVLDYCISYSLAPSNELYYKEFKEYFHVNVHPCRWTFFVYIRLTFEHRLLCLHVYCFSNFIKVLWSQELLFQLFWYSSVTKSDIKGTLCINAS